MKFLLKVDRSVSSLQVYGDKDADGFYRGEVGDRRGYVPCNMVSEIQVDDEETRDQLLMQGFLSTEASMEKIGVFISACVRLAHLHLNVSFHTNMFHKIFMCAMSF